MCRRTGSIGLLAGQVSAVGTMGLLGTLNVDVDAMLAVPTVAIGAGRSLVAAVAVVVVAPLVVTSPSARRSQLVGRGSLVEARWSRPVVRCAPLILSIPAARFVLFVGRRPPLPKLPNGLPMCRRIGSIGCSLNQAWAVGTMGLLGTPGVGTKLDAAARCTPSPLAIAPGAGTRLDAAARRAPSPLVVALVAWAVVTPLSSWIVARCRRSLSVERGPRIALSQGAARCPFGCPTAGRCAAAMGAKGWWWVRRGRSAPSAC